MGKIDGDDPLNIFRIQPFTLEDNQPDSTLNLTPTLAPPADQTRANDLFFQGSLVGNRLQTDFAPETPGVSAYTGGATISAPPTNTFGQGNGSHIPRDATPRFDDNVADCAALVTDTTVNSTREGQAQMFQAVLDAHKDNPQFIQNFLGMLGVEKSADLISACASPQQYASADNLARGNHTVGSALSTLVDHNMMSQDDVNRLVGEWSAPKGWFNGGKGNFNPWLATDMFAKAPSQTLQNMFFHSATNLAETKLQQDPNLANTLMASSAQVLAATSTNNQAAQLNQLRRDNHLADFVRSSMAGETALSGLPTLASASGGLSGGTIERLPMGGLTSLMFNSAYEGYDEYAGRLPGYVPTSSEDLKAVRVEMFNAATETLFESRESSNHGIEDHYKQSALFKDALTSVFQEDADAIIHESMLAPDRNDPGYRPQADNDNGFTNEGRSRLQEFFKLTLFTPPSGSYHNTFTEFLTHKMNDIRLAGINNTGAYDQLSNSDGHLSPREGARIVGEMMGLMKNGLESAMVDAKNDEKAKTEALKGLLDVVVSLGPLLGPEGLAAEVITTAAAESMKAFITAPVARSIVGMNREDAVNFILAHSPRSALTPQAMVKQLDQDMRSRMGNLYGDYSIGYLQADNFNGTEIIENQE